MDDVFPLKSSSISISKGNELCPQNNCKLSQIETGFRKSYNPLEYVFEGNIQVGTNTADGVRNKLFHFYSSNEITETIEKGANTIYYLSGAFDVYEGTRLDFSYPDYAYEIRNAELTFQNGLLILRMEAEEKGLVESLIG